ncbi:MAG: amino acid adenylation domain-containing protein, partial [Bacteroidota bacterium]
GGLVNLCYWHQDVYGLTAASRGTLFAGVAFDASAWEIYPYLLCGASLWPIANSEWRLQVDQLIQFFVENQISHTFLPPLVCQELAESDSALPDLKILTGGDVLSLSKSPKLSIYNNYGPTENTVVTTHFDLRNPYKGSIPIGRPIHNTAVYILSDELQLQPQGAIGELCIAGAGIARGYLNRSELTAEKFVPNPFVDGARMYRSGDLARWLPNGEIEFIGRKDQQVKIRGYRIELSEIESQLLLLEAVRETVVCALGQERQKYLVAYYTAEEAVERSTFIEHLTKSLPDYMLPLHFVKLDKIPLTAHGKIDRKNLPVPDIQSTTTYVAPTNAKEEKMQALWAEILNLKPEQISTDRSFFELGGHSLNAVVLTNKIRKAFEVTLPVTEVFVKQTIARLCKHLEALDKTAYTAIPQAPKQAYYPLSSAQERMYFINSLATESLAYNMPFLQKFEGRPDAVRLEATLKRLVDRHEIFRTTFHWIDQQAKQKIAPSIDIAIEQIQATTTDLSIVFKNFVQPFDLQKGPLLRMALAQLPNGDYYLMFDMHHIISDGISQNVILQDFERLYQGNALSPLRLQYKDFTHWQQREKGQQLAVQKAFWLDLFANEPTALNLPLDHARPSQNTFAGDFYSFRVDEEVSQKLKALSERSGATAFMLFLSAFHILLYKLSGQKDIVIGSPVSGRVHPDVERMVGLFVNTLPLRMELQGQQSFMDFLHAVKDRVLQCLDHQLYPYEELLNALNIDRDASRNPLFDVLFSFENFASQKGEASDDSPHLGPKTAQFDLSLIASESKSHFELSFEYSTALFQKQTIERFAIYLQNILSVIVHQPDKTIAHIDILPPLEREQLLNGFNNSKKAKQVATTTIDLFAAQVRHNPDQVILSYEGAAINYRQLQTYADRLATHLLQQGLTPGSLVGICMGRSIEMIIAMLGIWKAGGAYVPIDPSYPKDRMAYILKDAAVPMVLVDRAGAEVLPTLEGVSILDLQMHPQCYQEESLVDQKLPKLEPGMLAYVIYTSGSTGQPKGVMIEHGSLALRLQEEVELLHLNEEARTCLLTNFVFDVSLLEIFLPMICGGTLVIPSDGLVKDIPALLHLLQKQKVSLLQGTPSLYSSLLAFVDEKVADALSLSTLCVGGESLNQKLVDSIQTKLPNVQLNNHYGPTETTIDALVLEDVRSFDKNSIGRPLGQTEVYIFDEDFALVPQGVVGEICIGGPCLARAYLNQAELSSERFIEHPFHSGERLYRTGDLGCWLPDGQVAFVGRKDNQVKIRGYRMELGEIEQALSKHLMVDQVAVLVFGEAGDNFLAAYYKSEKIIPTDDWQGFLSAQLPTYMIPSCFIHMTAFPVNVNGKIDLKKLPPPNYEMSDQYEAPTNEMERKMTKAWSEVLKIDAAKISINQSFFELGGHSLRAVQLQALLKDQWQMDIALVELFQYPTIRELAQAKYSSSPVSSPSKGIIKLFEPSTKTEGNLFFIHDGSGDVHGYIALAKELETMNCWALRSPTLDGLAVQNDALEALAAVYVERITSIQAHGPYVLAGWSLGGVFALEVARQLEQQGETVEQLFLIDTHFIEEEEAAEDFSVEKEKAYIQTWLGEEMALASEGDDLSDLWQKVLQQLKEDRNKRHRFEQAVPMDIRSMIPYFDALELEKQLAFINTIRSLEKAVACYRPLGKVKCRLTYLKAADSTADVPALSDYAMDPAGVVTLAGNHFTLLQTPYVKALAACFHRLLEPSSEVIESVG